nr:MAG TPA: hypothetical protein [Podoviridae sp. ctY3D12]
MLALKDSLNRKFNLKRVKKLIYISLQRSSLI